MAQTRRLHRLPALILLTAGLGAGVACSGSGGGSNNGVASIKTASDRSTGSDGQSAKKDQGKTNPEDAMLAFARCMREHGIDMPDPDTSGGGGMVTIGGGPGADRSQLDAQMTKFQDADKACRDKLGDAAPQKPSPQQQQEMQDQALAFSRCMREHGVNMPDPNFDGEGHVTMKIDGASGLDPSDPKFEAAQQACGSAFGPKGAKGGPGLSVSGGKADGGAPGGKAGAIYFGGGATASAGSGK